MGPSPTKPVWYFVFPPLCLDETPSAWNQSSTSLPLLPHPPSCKIPFHCFSTHCHL